MDFVYCQVGNNYFSREKAFLSAFGLMHFVEFMYKTKYYLRGLSWREFVPNRQDMVQLNMKKKYALMVICAIAEYKIRHMVGESGYFESIV